MGAGFLPFLALGCLLGIKHALEPDHVVAVSAIAARSSKMWSASLAGVFWGIGHTATLFGVGMALLITKKEIPEAWVATAEFVVGAMIVFLGIVSLVSVLKGDNRKSASARSGGKAGLVKTALVGIVHGLAGSAPLVLLVMSLMDGVWQGALFILFFGLGTVAGMLAATTVIGLPFVLTVDKGRINRWLVGGTGGVSVLFGLSYMVEIGMNGGLFAAWLSRTVFRSYRLMA